MGDGAWGFLIGVDLGERDARGVIDADMDELPTASRARTTWVVLAGPITGDAMADALEAAELLDVEMDHAAWMLMLVAPGRLWRLEIADAR